MTGPTCPRRSDSAADALDEGDDAVLGVDVDPRWVDLDRDRDAPAVLEGDDDLAAVIGSRLACVVELHADQLGGVEGVLRGLVLLDAGLLPGRLLRAHDRRQVGALGLLLVAAG